VASKCNLSSCFYIHFHLSFAFAFAFVFVFSASVSVFLFAFFSPSSSCRNDDKFASEYNIEGGSVLHLVLALRGGKR
jgi:hypothetical protein